MEARAAVEAAQGLRDETLTPRARAEFFLVSACTMLPQVCLTRISPVNHSQHAQVFPGAAIVGPWVPLTSFPDWAHVPFSFTLEGKEVQSGMGASMMLAPNPALVAARALFGVRPGDWLFTGTPAGEEKSGGVQRERAGALKTLLMHHHFFTYSIPQASAPSSQVKPAPLLGATRSRTTSDSCSGGDTRTRVREWKNHKQTSQGYMHTAPPTHTLPTPPFSLHNEPPRVIPASNTTASLRQPAHVPFPEDRVPVVGDSPVRGVPAARGQG